MIKLKQKSLVSLPWFYFSFLKINFKKSGDFLGGPVVESLPPSAGGKSAIPDQRAKLP